MLIAAPVAPTAFGQSQGQRECSATVQLERQRCQLVQRVLRSTMHIGVPATGSRMICTCTSNT